MGFHIWHGCSVKSFDPLPGESGGMEESSTTQGVLGSLSSLRSPSGPHDSLSPHGTTERHPSLPSQTTNMPTTIRFANKPNGGRWNIVDNIYGRDTLFMLHRINNREDTNLYSPDDTLIVRYIYIYADSLIVYSVKRNQLSLL